MNRLRAKAGNVRVAFAAALCLAWLAPCGVRAADLPDVWFAGTRLIFETPQTRQDELAVATGDSGMARFLGATGATVAYQPGQQYVIVTTADRRTIDFTLGDAQYTVNGATQVAPFAPYVSGRDVYLPFMALAKALYVAAIPDGDTVVLQPQLGSLDVRSQARTTVLTLRGGTTLHYKRLSGTGDSHVALAFEGLGSTLEAQRHLPGAGVVRGVTINTSGVTRNPVTVVDIDAIAGSVHAVVPGDSRNALSIAFAPAGVALAGTALPLAAAEAPVALVPPPAPQPVAARTSGATPALPVPTSVPAPLAQPQAAASLGSQPPAQITGFKTNATGDDGVSIDVAIGGNATYEWHRLADNRWYVDLKPAVLTIPSQDVPLHYQALPAMRLKSFVGPSDGVQTVRIAFSLDSPRTISLAQTAGDLTIAVGSVDDSTLQHVGYGQFPSNGPLAATSNAAPANVAALNSASPAPALSLPLPAPAPAWKFAPAAPYNSRLIVLDPGHGGSDPGSQHNGLSEKALNLDVSFRLRDLLVSRGWVVKMTRTTDVDVYAPNDSARDELQARCDLANAVGARFFISIHTNAFTSSSQHGTTTYFYQAQSYGLAQAVHERLAATLPTTDNGIIKENYYVIHHTKMPSILIEMAFDSNPTDAEYLHSNAFLQKVALGIADGVGSYASSPSQPVSATDQEPGSGQ